MKETEKTNDPSYNLRGRILQSEETEKEIGVTIDSTLKFKTLLKVNDNFPTLIFSYFTLPSVTK